MVMMTPDFTQEYKPLTPGNYTARVSAYKPGVSQKNEQYIKWKLEIMGMSGETIENVTMLEGRGAGLLKHFLKSCDGVYDGGPFDPDSYIGSRIGIEVGEREYDGKMQATVKKVYPADASADAPVFTDADIPF